MDQSLQSTPKEFRYFKLSQCDEVPRVRDAQQAVFDLNSAPKIPTANPYLSRNFELPTGQIRYSGNGDQAMDYSQKSSTENNFWSSSNINYGHTFSSRTKHEPTVPLRTCHCKIENNDHYSLVRPRNEILDFGLPQEKYQPPLNGGYENQSLSKIKNTTAIPLPACKGTAENHKNDSQRTTKKIQEYELPRLNGGLTHRVFPLSNRNPHIITTDSYRDCNNSNYVRQLQTATKQTPDMAMQTSSRSNKSYSDNSNYNLFETDSNHETCSASSEESNSSKKSVKTVKSKRSSKDLRKLVKSQCKLQTAIDGCIEKKHNKTNKQEPICKHQNEKVFLPSTHNVTTQITKGDFIERHSDESLTMSLADLVNCEVVNPIMRKLQHMHLDKLQEDLSLMHEIDCIPNKVEKLRKAVLNAKIDGKFAKN